MDPSPSEQNAEPNERILALVSEYLDRRQSREEITPERFLAEHAEVALALEPYLAALPLIDRAFSSASTTQAESAGEVAGGHVRLPPVAGYQLIEEIGRGGMGVVYKALQLSTKRVVALKVMLAGPFASPAARRRFDREVELAARLEHPGIVRVLEGGDVAGQRYYAMSYLAGRRLDRYLAATQPDVRTMLRLFAQICEAVEFAHAHGVIHRDLKPGNILIDDQGHPHILDFGLAKATDQADSDETLTLVSLPGQVMGTLFYLSPEQAAGLPGLVDARTDVYALGVTLFEALTGSLPLDTTGRPSEVIQRILETPSTPPTSLSDRVDTELETIVLKALEKEQDRRYPSAQELADDIGRYLAGDPILARRPSTVYRLRKKLRKHRQSVAVAVAAVALPVIVLMGVSWWEARERARARREALAVQQSLESQIVTHMLGVAHTLFEKHPELPEVTLVWAQALYRTEQQTATVELLQNRLRRDPSCWSCRALLAEFHRAMGNIAWADALEAFNAGEVPDTAEAWYLRSFATLALGRALECATQAVEHQPSHVLAWDRLAWLRFETGDFAGALAGADELIELGEDVKHWTLFRGAIFAKQGDFRRALREYARISNPVYMGHACRGLREYEKAVACYDQALQRLGEKPVTAWHHYQRATPLWILGRTNEALRDYERARRLLGRPAYGDARRFLILCERGQPQEAQEVLKAALRDVKYDWSRQIYRCLASELTPEQLVADGRARHNPEQLCEACYYAGEVCLLAGRRDDARDWFEQCVQTGVVFDPDAALGTPMNEYELAHWRLETLFPDAP